MSSESLSVPNLPGFGWLALLRKEDRDLLSSYGEFLPGHPGNVLIREGEPTTSELYVVLSGQLDVRVPLEDGTYLTVGTVGPGETLGEVSLFDPGVTSASVVANTFSQLWRIGATSLDQFILDNPGAGNILLRTLIQILCQRVRHNDPLAVSCSKPVSPEALETETSTEAEAAAE